MQRLYLTALRPQVMLGYLDRPEATLATVDAEGFLWSGDIGRVDADGFFYISDRLKVGEPLESR
jgi:long-subunit acyl-CoA synthetase (AMP-forming)